jgi:molecular chaperone DnaK (HSP70)
MMLQCSIDLGTTYSTTTVMGPYGQPAVLSTKHGNRTTPSYVDKEEVLVFDLG